MALADMVQQVLNFLIVLVTIIFILTLVSAVIITDTGEQVQELFTQMCTQQDGSGMIHDLSYDNRATLLQFMLPQSMSGRVNMRMTYPRNTFAILDSLFDESSCNIKSAANSLIGLYLERTNYRFLETCIDKQCFCAGRTRMNYLTYENLEYTACFPRMYIFAKGTFNDKVNSITCSDDLQVFRDATMQTLEVLKQNIDWCEGEDPNCNPNFNVFEAQKIFDCYNFLLDLSSIGGTGAKYTFEYRGVTGLYSLTLNNPTGTLQASSGEELESALSEYYDLTKAGIISEIMFCTEIPNEGNCYCPYSGNYMVSKNSLQGSGLLLGLAGSKGGSIHDLKIGSFLVTATPSTSSCTLNTRTIS
jgi:hypothetical protein